MSQEQRRLREGAQAEGKLDQNPQTIEKAQRLYTELMDGAGAQQSTDTDPTAWDRSCQLYDAAKALNLKWGGRLHR